MKVFAAGKKWTYYKCPNCHWYSTTANENQENADYECYATFDQDVDKYDSYVEQAMEMLKYKFKLLGYIPDSFIDIGCSEGVWIKAYAMLYAGKASGIEVSSQKIEKYCSPYGIIMRQISQWLK